MSIEKRRKTCFITWKSLFLFFLFCNYSFASAVQRGIEKLKLALPWYFKTLKMEKIEKDLPKCSLMDCSTLLAAATAVVFI
jgi:hypothetical protein